MPGLHQADKTKNTDKTATNSNLFIWRQIRNSDNTATFCLHQKKEMETFTTKNVSVFYC